MSAHAPGGPPGSPQDSDDGYTALFTQHPSPMWVCAQDSHAIRDANEAAIAALGYSHPESLKLKFTDLFPGDSTRESQPDLLSPGALRTKDGRILPVRLTSLPFVARGEPARLFIAQPMPTVTETPAGLVEQAARLRAIVDAEPDCVKIVTPDNQLVEINPAGLAILEAASAAEVCEQQLIKYILPSHRAAFETLHRRVLQGETVELDFEMIGRKGTRRWMHTRATPLRDTSGRPEAVLSICRDITGSKQLERQHDCERRTLELLARGESLAGVLDALARGFEELYPGLLCSVLIVDEASQRLRRGSAPSLPPSYIEALEQLEIGPSAGACVRAAHSGNTTIVVDIASDPTYVDFRELPLAHGLRACWSVPIRCEVSRILGAFGLYCREPRSPRPSELAAIERGAFLAGMAILRHRPGDAFRLSEDRFSRLLHAAPDATLIVNRRMIITMVNSAAENVFGYDVGELNGLSINELMPESGRARHAAHVSGYLKQPTARAMGSATVFQASLN